MKSKFDYDGKFKKTYYRTASEGNKDFNKEIFFTKIIKYLNKEDVLCEFGCGDGSKLAHLKKYVNQMYGFDISQEAIKRAKRNIPKGNFFVSNSGKIFREGQFDVTITLATLEHVDNPQIFLKEMIRVTKKGGYIIGLCPNFGSPLFPSPPKIVDLHFLRRVILVIKRIINYKKFYKNTIFKSVNPLIDRKWQPDFDTVSEVSLDRIVKIYKDKIVYANSFWSTKPYLYIPFSILAALRIKPFVYWGYICFFVIKK